MVKTQKELHELCFSHTWTVINKLENVGHPNLDYNRAVIFVGKAIRLNTAYGLKTTVEVDPRTHTINIS